MSTHATRKRVRDTQEEKLPPRKREPADLVGRPPASTGSSSEPSTQTEGLGRSQQIEERGFKKDNEFWFEDGTAILVARDIEFRIYEGILAGLSLVFRNLFSEYHSMRSIHMHEGQILSCPVVLVSDSPEDLRYILRACFSKRLGSLYEERNPSYHEISAAIRLGDKYKLTELYSQSLKYLKRFFPSTLHDYMSLDTYVPPGWDELEAIGVVNLARATGELSILPSALVACICGELSIDANSGEGIGYGIAREGDPGSRELLSPYDLTICFEGKTRLRAATMAAVFRTFAPMVSRECGSSDDCRRALSKVLLGLEKQISTLLESYPFLGFEAFVDTTGGLDACSACVAMVRNRREKEHRLIWDQLPEILDIDVPGWEEEPPPRFPRA